MMPGGKTITREVTHGHIFCGLGGGARGFNRGEARVGNLEAKFRCVGGIDVDPASIADFDKLAGVKGTCLDLFSREQYVAFWGNEPPQDWREALPIDIRIAFGGERPNIIFLSAPCKGFSGLLAESLSKTGKYQALNGLTLRGMYLALEAFRDDPPELIVFENVPRIAKRGRWLLDQIVSMLKAFGYAVAETTHDCGELGGLGQSRKRFLLVARHIEKVPPFLYEPMKRPLRGVGEIIGRLPVPGPEIELPMHRMPALHWKTWVRLAFVEAGSDWRSLNKLNVNDGMLADFGLAPDVAWNHDVLGVRRWGEPSGVVTSRSGPTNGRYSVADPRAPDDSDRGAYGVGAWDQHGAVVTSARSPGQGRFSVADPRINGDRNGPLGVTEWQKEAGTVAGESFPTNGPFAVQDPRIDGHEKSIQMGVGTWDRPAAVIKGDVSVGTGRYAVADPRMQGKPRFNNVYRIVQWGQTSPAVAGSGGPAGGLAVADPRTNFGPNTHHNVLQVHRFSDHSKTISSGNHPSGGALSVADPRFQNWHPGASSTKLRVTDWDKNAGVVTGSQQVGSGALAVADPRPSQRDDYKQNKYRVTGMEEPAGAVIAASTTGNGAFAVADPRPEGLNERREAYMTGGHYGVLPWERHSNAVSASALHDNGFNSVADPRDGDGEPAEFSLPSPSDRLICCIRALDGTWHRPFTTLELAALQGLVDPEELLILEGLSDSSWRERIGNAVPPPAAAAIASVMGRTLLMAWSGQTFALSSEPIWVQPIALALSVRTEAGPA